ncbi:aminotransferase class I/II-fold pyridoxal phosphate-dependent enzyme [Synechococcus sp. A15-28]|jgi:8-amino-7-oxononanoate synthase|uniref:aminotransferase class I/II-fold pyridoxal phosphate-dependent enzyme n=1 Tax=Synechococcus sp. A15-28 TaxID=1050638 RepID=UPI0016483A10|nr:aminotransferase class I/II-fold pyridoxal phosphate-dependent enzyme [Synechococcus sp. A15-28]MBA4733434.1 aminotransferase class I/II-fold pyridoxal phosphate-dependent enzyme [Synechococcus sp.]QNI41685.1 8-amino-7-oxononanoate synthase [Synechococcus sp. A15-28]|tara:strand:- start:404 stop:1531 length:1128 start_codon:yes stop_codon:yes gene_type:complete
MASLDPARRRTLHSWSSGDLPWTLQRAQTEQPPLLDLASNDYLGLSRHPEVIEAASEALRNDGVGAGASRLVTGSRPRHAHLEADLAEWLGRACVLLFPSGFQANLAAVSVLANRHTTVLADRLIHHSLLVGVRASGARLQRFQHNDLTDLERRLEALAGQPGSVVVLSESLFSMEGTSPDVAALAVLCQRFGADLLMDEAHALGVLGPEGRGLCFGIEPVRLISGTFGKAFGSGGAFLACDADLGDVLLQTSGAFRYTTALAPPLVAGAQAALNLIRSHPHWSRQLQQRASRWRDALESEGWTRPAGLGPVLPLLLGDDAAALAGQAGLEDNGLLCVAIRPPTVPEGTARLRLVLRRDLPDETVEQLLKALPCP